MPWRILPLLLNLISSVFLLGVSALYLTGYQLQKPVIPFLHYNIQQLVKELLSLTIKSEVIDNCKEDYKALLKIDLRDVRNHTKKKDMNVGFGTLDELQSLLRKDLISQADINKFLIEAREFLVTSLEKMFRKNLHSFNIVRYMSVFDPKVLLNQASRVCKSLFGKLMCALVGSKIVSSCQGDKALSEFTSFHESSMSEKRLAFEKFNRHEQRLDEFFMKQTRIVRYTANLLPILKFVLVLNDGQANVERCFSVNNNALKCNMSEKSIMSRKLIIDHMKVTTFCHSLPITKSLLQSARSSRQRYEQYLRERQESKLQNEKTEQLKILDKEIGELKCVISGNKKIREKLGEEFVRLPDEAEKQNNFLRTKELLSKGNSLKRKSYEKLEESRKREEALKVVNNVIDYFYIFDILFYIFVGLHFLIYPFWTNVLFCDPQNVRVESQKVKKLNIGSKWVKYLGKLD